MDQEVNTCYEKYCVIALLKKDQVCKVSGAAQTEPLTTTITVVFIEEGSARVCQLCINSLFSIHRDR